MPGVRAAVASVEGTATIVGTDGDRIGGDGPPTIGTNWIDDPALNPYRLAEGRAPRPPARSSSTAAPPRTATSSVGDHDHGPDAEARGQVTVVGIATFGELDSLGPTTYTAFTLPQASELFAQRPGHDLGRARGRRCRREPGDAARRDHRSRSRHASRR